MFKKKDKETTNEKSAFILKIEDFAQGIIEETKGKKAIVILAVDESEKGTEAVVCGVGSPYHLAECISNIAGEKQTKTWFEAGIAMAAIKNVIKD